jgi:hypothetical protein
MKYLLRALSVFDDLSRLPSASQGAMKDKNVLNGVNYFGLTPRYSIVKNKLTAGLGLGLDTYKIKETENTDACNDSNSLIFLII